MFLVCYFLRPCSITDPAVAKAVALFFPHSLSFPVTLILTCSLTFFPHIRTQAFIQRARSPNERSTIGDLSVNLRDSICLPRFIVLHSWIQRGTLAVRRSDDSKARHQIFFSTLCSFQIPVDLDRVRALILLLFRVLVVVEVELIIVSRGSSWRYERRINREKSIEGMRRTKETEKERESRRN